MTHGMIHQAAFQKLVDMRREFDQLKTRLMQSGVLTGLRMVPTSDSACVVITQEEIEPNDWGECKFTKGARGSETADGDALLMYYRGFEGAKAIPSGTKCLALWCRCGSLNAEGDEVQTGWVLIWIEFETPPPIRFVQAASDVTAGGSGNFQFMDATGVPPSFSATSEPPVSMHSPAVDIAAGEIAYGTKVNNTHWEVQPRTCPVP